MQISLILAPSRGIILTKPFVYFVSLFTRNPMNETRCVLTTSPGIIYRYHMKD